jgi:hypothetical protein
LAFRLDQGVLDGLNLADECVRRWRKSPAFQADDAVTALQARHAECQRYELPRHDLSRERAHRGEADRFAVHHDRLREHNVVYLDPGSVVTRDDIDRSDPGKPMSGPSRRY